MKYNAFIEAEGILSQEFAFLAKAIGDNAINPAMAYIHVEPSDKGEGLLGIVTDGRRLHLVDPLPEIYAHLGLTPGYWKVLKTTSKSAWLARLDDSETKDWQFPSWRKVVPTEKAVYETEFVGFALTKTHHNSGKLSEFLHDLPEVTRIDLKFLYALGTDQTWKLIWLGGLKPLKFIAVNRMAVIMPMQA